MGPTRSEEDRPQAALMSSVAETLPNDKAGADYWNAKWDKIVLPEAFNPFLGDTSNYRKRRFHEHFVSVVGSCATQGKKLVDIGSAQSVLLPYFGFEVAGLDRSAGGCVSSRLILRREGVNGRVYCADLFDPPKDTLEEYDVVFSYGVVEHFRNTVDCVAAMSRFLKPGGLMVTLIPTLSGIPRCFTKNIGSGRV